MYQYWQDDDPISDNTDLNFIRRSFDESMVQDEGESIPLSTCLPAGSQSDFPLILPACYHPLTPNAQYLPTDRIIEQLETSFVPSEPNLDVMNFLNLTAAKNRSSRRRQSVNSAKFRRVPEIMISLPQGYARWRINSKVFEECPKTMATMYNAIKCRLDFSPEIDAVQRSDLIILGDSIKYLGLQRLQELVRKINSESKNAKNEAYQIDNEPLHLTQPIKQNEMPLLMFFTLESPQNIYIHEVALSMFNLTATYRRDSDFVTPYAKWVPFTHPYNGDGLSGFTIDRSLLNVQRNFPPKKTKSVGWFVSNCGARNDRLEYAMELSKYIKVDIYGKCGTMECPKNSTTECNMMLTEQYKFYLAFENSNCVDYITEKFLLTGLQNGVVPIVMGARRKDYEAVAPPNSFLHVDDYASPKHLAKHLNYLANNYLAYSAYRAWVGTGRFIDTNFWCRVCQFMRLKYLSKNGVPSKIYPDIRKWWEDEGMCVKGRWNKNQ